MKNIFCSIMFGILGLLIGAIFNLIIGIDLIIPFAIIGFFSPSFFLINTIYNKVKDNDNDKLKDD